MAKPLEIRKFVDYIRSTNDAIKRATFRAQLATLVLAEGMAKRNAQAQFIGRNDRRLSGYLMNSIYYGFEKRAAGVEGFLGVKNVPYAAIHEFGSKDLPGGVIKPVRAKHLWIPQYKNSGKMTPREFIRMKTQDPSSFFMNEKVAGKWDSQGPERRLIPLFFLVDKVKIPERPYLRPAMEAASERFPEYFERYLKEETQG